MINICFHGVGRPQRVLEADEDHYWISAGMYEQVLDEIAGRSDVALSFDDGNVSDVEAGLPGLLQRGLTATFFVLAARLDQPGSVGTDDIHELRDRGMKIGTHGMNHVPWRGLSDPELRRELVEARQVISDASGSPVVEAALPLGRYDRSVLSALRRLGYQRVYSSDRRPTTANRWLQPRYSIRAGDTIDSVRANVLTSPSPVQLLRSRAIGLVKQVR